MGTRDISVESTTIVAMLEDLPEVGRKLAYEKAREAIERVAEDHVWEEKFKTNPQPLKTIADRIQKAKAAGDVQPF
jgi:hypothetical protein